MAATDREGWGVSIWIIVNETYEKMALETSRMGLTRE